MFLTWVSTVLGAIQSCSAMAWFDRPSAMSANTSRSRSVRCSRGLWRRGLTDQPGHDGGLDNRFASGDPVDGVGELGDVGDLVFEYVSEASGVVFEQFDDVLGLDVLRHDHDGGTGPRSADAPGGLEALGGLGGRHANVGQDDVGRRSSTRFRKWVASAAVPTTSKPASFRTSAAALRVTTGRLRRRRFATRSTGRLGRCWTVRSRAGDLGLDAGSLLRVDCRWIGSRRSRPPGRRDRSGRSRRRGRLRRYPSSLTSMISVPGAPDGDGGGVRGGVLGHVGERFAHHEIGGGFGRCRKALGGTAVMVVAIGVRSMRA